MLSSPDPWKSLDVLRSGVELGFVVLHDIYTITTVDDVVKPIIALGNSDTGGIVYFGIYGPKGYEERRVFPPDHVDELVALARTRIMPSPPAVTLSRRGDVIALTVASASETTGLCWDGSIGHKHGVLVVENGRVCTARDQQLERLLDRAGICDAEAQRFTPAFFRDLDPHLLDYARIRPDELQSLIDVGVSDAERIPTRAGAVAFGGSELVRRYPKLGIRYVRYEFSAHDVTSRGIPPAVDHIVEASISAAVFEVINDGLRWLPDGVSGDDASVVFRELLVNAVGHRSLVESRLGPVEVQFFTDQVRIRNTGGLVAGKARLAGPDRVSGCASRNPRLMRMLRELSLLTQRGLGLARARDCAARAGCRIELINHADYFEAHIILDPDRVVRAQRLDSVATRTRVRMTPRARHELLLEAMGDDEWSARELAEALDWALPTVRANLRDMVKRKLVKPVGGKARSPKQRYQVR